jgi:hypothetical protein
MNASEMTFGVEIETTVPSGSVNVGRYMEPLAVPALPAGWVCKGDGSIRPAPGRMGCEFVSPILSGVEGLASVVAALAAIRGLGASVNPSCGFHVHIGFVRERASLERLASLVANFEKAIYASTGTHLRERSNYCRPIQAHGNVQNAIDRAGRERYHVLNLTNIMGNGHGFETVEFRAFAGTLNTAKIVGYVRMCLALAQRSLSTLRKTNWTAKTPVATSPIHRSGEGQTALTRLFYALGWTKGRTKIVYGSLEGPRIPSLANSKKTLMQLARKYDAQN